MFKLGTLGDFHLTVDMQIPLVEALVERERDMLTQMKLELYLVQLKASKKLGIQNSNFAYRSSEIYWRGL